MSYHPFEAFSYDGTILYDSDDLIWRCPSEFKDPYNRWHKYVMSHSFNTNQMNYWDLKDKWNFIYDDRDKIERQIRCLSLILNGSSLTTEKRIQIASWMLSEMIHPPRW